MSVSPSPDAPVGYWELLRQNKNFRWLWSGHVVSLLGDWFNLIASASLLAQLTQSGLAIGGLFVVRMLAPFLVSPIAGVITDRYNRKAILITTDIVRAVAVMGFLLVKRPEDVWLLYVLTGIQLGGSGFAFPARNAILPDIVEPEGIGTANTIMAVTWSTMLAIGAALGGLVAGFWGITPAFVIDALTFVVSSLLIWQMAYSRPKEAAQSDKSVAAAVTQYLEGLAYLRQRFDQLFIACIKGINALIISSGFQIIQVSLAETIYVIGDSGGISLGLFYGTAGIGTGVGPIVARYITGDDDRKMRWGIVVAWLISGAGMWVTSLLGPIWLTLIGTFLRGVGGGIVWVYSTQLLLQLVDPEIRGRIFATEFMIFTLLSAFGAGIIGWLIDGSLTLRIIMQSMGTIVIIPIILWIIWIYVGQRSPKLVGSD